VKRIIVVAVLLVVAGVAVSIAFLADRSRVASHQPPIRDASLLFLGVTNLPTGKFAVFCLTNGTRAPIACIPEALESKTGETWTRQSLMSKGSRFVRDWIGVREELKPRQAFTFLVPSATNTGPWRLVYFCQEQAEVVDTVTDTMRHLTDTNSRRTGLRQFSGRSYSVFSPEVAE
jgi:hypothetical protein